MIAVGVAAALLFLYGRVLGSPLPMIEDIAPAKRPRHVPVVLSQREVKLLLAALAEPARICASLMYGSGLRVTECVSLRVKDVDLDRREIVVRGGKGNKDRRTPLAESFVAALERQLKHGLAAYQQDRRADVRCTGLSSALA